MTLRHPGRLLTLGAALLVAGCATKMTVTSSPPGVAIFAGDKRLGETPLEVSSETAPAETSGGYLLRLEKAGFNRVWVWVPNGIRGMSVVVNLQPFVRHEDAVTTRELSRVEMDAVGARILDMQRELLLKGPVADDVVQALLAQYPDIGAAHYLAAVNLIRQGKKDEAQAAAKQALALAPGEPDYVVLYRELGGDPAETIGAATTTETETESETETDGEEEE